MECLMNKVYDINSYQMQSVRLFTQDNQNSQVLTGLLDEIDQEQRRWAQPNCNIKFSPSARPFWWLDKSSLFIFWGFLPYMDGNDKVAATGVGKSNEYCAHIGSVSFGKHKGLMCLARKTNVILETGIHLHLGFASRKMDDQKKNPSAEN
ncbi:hypothetical protein POM88_013404 [Heracleum sosnowskyi]|uniref:Uncharacterized protein n=1 Tax=Heracleum sosnowskyi TaxID=360622 RepID=A0AAD8J0H5_9APIA|nr:hypothetical protein POM88_013404 [Heracleum sosnowskyi]